MYKWIDQINLKEPTLNYFAETYGSSELSIEIKELEKHFTSGGSDSIFINQRIWSRAPKKYLRRNIRQKNKSSILWINP